MGFGRYWLFCLLHRFNVKNDEITKGRIQQLASILPLFWFFLYSIIEHVQTLLLKVSILKKILPVYINLPHKLGLSSHIDIGRPLTI